MVRALLQRPLLVLFYLAAADVQCEGEMPMGHLGVSGCVCGDTTPCFSPRDTHFQRFFGAYSSPNSLWCMSHCLCAWKQHLGFRGTHSLSSLF